MDTTREIEQELGAAWGGGMKKYQVLNENGGTICGQDNTLRDAVLSAAGHDGWGAEYARDSEGAMRLFSSHDYIGNNTYNRQADDAFAPSSDLADDGAAEDDVAAQVFKRGVLHSRYRLEIVMLTYNDADVLTHVDGRAVEELAAEAEQSVENVRRHYNGGCVFIRLRK